MTRLIDADALIEDIRQHSESYFADDFAHEWVDKQPTVDAIPISWIENFIDDIGDLEDEMTMRVVYSLLINEWRKENDTVD